MSARFSFPNHPFFYYFNGGLMEARMRMGGSGNLSALKRRGATKDRSLFSRLNYYCSPPPGFSPGKDWESLSDIRLPEKQRTYYFDLMRYAQYFPKNLRLKRYFGDNTELFKEPTLVKTRPIAKGNENNVLLKFNEIRHFQFIHDKVPFDQKKDLLFGRGHISHQKPARLSFYEKYFDHPQCDLGQINKGTAHDHWFKPKVSIKHHLQYKFILCLEGVDVASNLKWVMSSNSIAVMPPPKYESWFMESRLVPGEHYIQIKEDFSNLEEQLAFYGSQPELCEKISRNAQEYIRQFQDSKQEALLGVLVLDRYFSRSGQMESLFPHYQ